MGRSKSGSNRFHTKVPACLTDSALQDHCQESTFFVAPVVFPAWDLLAYPWVFNRTLTKKTPVGSLHGETTRSSGTHVGIFPHAKRFQKAATARAVFDHSRMTAHAVDTESPDELDARPPTPQPVRQKHAGTVIQGVTSDNIVSYVGIVLIYRKKWLPLSYPLALRGIMSLIFDKLSTSYPIPTIRALRYWIPSKLLAFL